MTAAARACSFARRSGQTLVCQAARYTAANSPNPIECAVLPSAVKPPTRFINISRRPAGKWKPSSG